MYDSKWLSLVFSVCIVPGLFPSWTREKNQNQLHLEQEYYATWSYENWKEALQQSWTTEGIITLSAQVSHLVYLLDFNISALKKDENNTFYRNSAWCAYNALREMLDFPFISTLDQIDDDWVNNQAYIFWKEEKTNAGKQQNSNSLSHQRYEIAWFTEHHLSKLRQEPLSIYDRRQALHGYNFLKELQGLPGNAQDLEDIDSQWLDEQAYVSWKDHLQKEWSSNKIDEFTKQINNILLRRSRALDDLKSPDKMYTQKVELYSYNFVRELLHLEVAKSYVDVDQDWLKEVQNETNLYSYIERLNRELPTINQKELLAEARELLHLEDDIILLSCKGKGSWARAPNYLTLTTDPDLNRQYYYLYHELGHIIYKDIFHHVDGNTSEADIDSWIT